MNEYWCQVKVMSFQTKREKENAQTMPKAG